MIDTGNGQVPKCKGDDLLDAPCDDYNDCSINDKCVPVTNFGDLITAACRGEASGLPCEDYNECSDNDTCVDISTSNRLFGRNILCQGRVVEGRPCNDYDDNTDDEVCFEVDNGFSTCRSQASPPV
jgi:hypothetical protein